MWKARRKVEGEKRLTISNVAFTVLGALHYVCNYIRVQVKFCGLWRAIACVIKRVICKVLV